MFVVTLTNKENHASKYGKLQTDQHSSDDFLVFSYQFDHFKCDIE